jgi:hypothetical protein
MKYVTERNHVTYILSEIPVRGRKIKEWVASKDSVEKWVKVYKRKYLSWKEAEIITGLPVPEQLELGL